MQNKPRIENFYFQSDRNAKARLGCFTLLCLQVEPKGKCTMNEDAADMGRRAFASVRHAFTINNAVCLPFARYA